MWSQSLAGKAGGFGPVDSVHAHRNEVLADGSNQRESSQSLTVGSHVLGFC